MNGPRSLREDEAEKAVILVHKEHRKKSHVAATKKTTSSTKLKKQNETGKSAKLLSKFLKVEKSSESSSSELAQHQHAKEQDLFKKTFSCEAHEDEEQQHIQEDLAIPGTSSRFQNIIKKLCQMNKAKQNLEISEQTVSRRLIQEGFKSRRPAHQGT
ncbi:hypothetical protein FQA39_LY00354 [Lamprigera yunnana]|nr:hypothetical protein FQA39_LY00354 [Lamprigera yunnana]